MLIDRDGDDIVLHVSPTAKDRAKEIAGGRYDAKARVWRYPLSWGTCITARAVFGAELQVGASLMDWAEGEAIWKEAALRTREAKDARGPDFLYPYQRVGAEFLRTAGSALVADEMGTGKTVQTIAALEVDEAYPALIVCPTSVKSVWAREFKKWAPGRRVLVAPSGTAKATEAAVEIANGGADVLIIGWEAIKSLTKLAPFGSIRLQTCVNCDPASTRAPNRCQREPKALNGVRWETVVADEAHRAKNPKAEQTRALWALGDRSARRIALTGTPIANSAEDLWSIMRFVSPKEFPTKWAWIDRYAQTSPNIWSGGVDVLGLRVDRREELDKYFLPRFIRRTKAEVLPDLPPKVYERREVALSGKQLKAYKQMESEMMAELEGGLLTATNSMTASLRLRQLASAYGEVTSTVNWEGGDESLLVAAAETSVTLSEPSSKLDELERVLEELGGQQAVIFAESRQLIELAAQRIDGKHAYVLLTGAVPEEERAENVEDFQSGTVQLLLATVGAGSEGITLTAASTAIFLQRPYSAVLNAQAEDRLHRVGQEADSVLYIDIVATDTVEDKVFEVLRRKALRLQDVVRDKEFA